jgi:hypothetical protein
LRSKQNIEESVAHWIKTLRLLAVLRAATNSSSFLERSASYSSEDRIELTVKQLFLDRKICALCFRCSFRITWISIHIEMKAEFRLIFPGKHRVPPFFLMVAMLPLYTQPAIAGNNNPETTLPDAPGPVVSATTSPRPAQQQASQQSSDSSPLLPAPRLAKYIGTNRQTVRLSPREKLELSGWEQLQPYAFATQLMAAGWEQLLDSNPKYGTDSGAFGERLGAAALLQDSRALLSDGILASVFRQDPRYYRQGTRTTKQRILHAMVRVVVIRTDAGNNAPNYSQLIGNAGATALTMAYYPAGSATWSKTGKGYGISLVEGALGNEIHEFTPELKRLAFHRHRN